MRTLERGEHLGQRGLLRGNKASANDEDDDDDDDDNIDGADDD